MNNKEREIIPELREDNKSFLASFYEEVEKVKIIEIPKRFNKNPIRPAIMAILRNGVEDKDLHQKRYALNALEIKNLLNNDAKLIKKLTLFKKGEVGEDQEEMTKKDEIGYTNLYFHLKKLEKVNAIKKVAFVIEKSHKIAYYGRTARFILLTNPGYEQKYFKEIFGELGKFLRVTDPEVILEDFYKAGEEYYKLRSQRVKFITMFLANNEKIMIKNQINIEKLFSCLKLIDLHYSEYSSILQTMNERLSLII
ncbi:MAG: hypothetical protein ACFFAU_11405 [Candidatus Hodarchaeota archaeon]